MRLRRDGARRGSDRSWVGHPPGAVEPGRDAHLGDGEAVAKVGPPGLFFLCVGYNPGKYIGYMHGQKKRRKRTADGLFEIDGQLLRWSLVSEPQWTTEHGAKGICFSVQAQKGGHRELVLEYPFEQPGLRPEFPQRPALSAATLEADVRRVIAAGWKPLSRGKALLYLVPKEPPEAALSKALRSNLEDPPMRDETAFRFKG